MSSRSETAPLLLPDARGDAGKSLDDYTDVRAAAGPPEPRRWYILFAYGLFAMCQGLVWGTFSTVPDATIAALSPNVDSDDIDFLLNWGPIAYVPTVIIPMMLMEQGPWGLKLTVVLGSSLVAAGAFVRCIPFFGGAAMRHAAYAIYFLHVGQCLNGLAGPMVMAAPSFVSAVWFPPRERTWATALGFLGNNLGPALGFLVALPVQREPDLPWLLYAESILAAISLAMILLHFPAAPRMAPSATARSRRRADPHVSVNGSVNDEADAVVPRPSLRRAVAVVMAHFREMGRSLLNVPFVLLALSGGIQGGVFNGWSASLPVLLKPMGISSDRAQWLGFFANVAGISGALLVGFISERLFHRKYKRLLLLLLIASAGCFLLFSMMLPAGFMPNDAVLLHAPFGAMAVCLCAGSLLLGATNPIYYELGAEMTYPIGEGSSVGVITELDNMAALILIFLFAKIPNSWEAAVMAITVAICALLMLLAKERYGRANVDEVTVFVVSASEINDGDGADSPVPRASLTGSLS